ncbi:MAG TPA: hypothetical protein VNI54_11365 [Thermoanaerobaculia bacterium]|nr:hypothetical protein [Thermoanaerobaculia bacterium]
MKTISLFTLIALGIIETSHGPFLRPDFGANHALAAARGNVLLAWSEKNETGHARVHVALLDSAGRAISPARELPVLNPSRDAVAPTVTTDGASFIVAWQEVLGLQQTVAMTLDANGQSATAPQPFGVETVAGDIAPPQLDALSASVVKTAAPAPGIDTSAPHITQAGSKYAVVWSSTNRIHYRLTNESTRRITTADVDVNARPRIDCGMTNCLVVYATRGGGVAGFAFDHTRTDAPVQLQLASNARDTEVVMVTNARALITWYDGEKLLSRSLDLGGKRRATR